MELLLLWGSIVYTSYPCSSIDSTMMQRTLVFAGTVHGTTYSSNVLPQWLNFELLPKRTEV